MTRPVRRFGDYRDQLLKAGYGSDPKAELPEYSDTMSPPPDLLGLTPKTPEAESKEKPFVAPPRPPEVNEMAGKPAQPTASPTQASAPSDDEFDQDKLDKVIKFESGGDPSRISNNSKTHAGLIQFGQDVWKGVAKAHGTPDVSWDEMRTMTYDEQLPYVKTYLRERGITKDSPIGDYYLAVAAPAMIGKKDDDIAYKRGSDAVTQNPAWDRNKDGEISVGELRSTVGNGSNSQDSTGLSFNMERATPSAPAQKTQNYVDTTAPGFESSSFAKQIQERIDAEFKQPTFAEGTRPLLDSRGGTTGDPAVFAPGGGDPSVVPLQQTSNTTATPQKPSVQEYLKQHPELLPQNDPTNESESQKRWKNGEMGRELTPEQQRALDQEPSTVGGQDELDLLRSKMELNELKGKSIEERRARFEADAARQSAQIGIEQSDAQNKFLERQQNDRANLQMRDAMDRQDIEKKRSAEMKTYQALVDRPPTKEIKGWLNTGNTGKNILHGIAAIGLGYLQKPDQILNLIKQDVDLQAKNIQNSRDDWQTKLNSKQNVIAMYDKDRNNLDESTALAESFMTKSALNETQKIMAETNSKLARARLGQLESVLKDRLDTIQVTYADRKLQQEHAQALKTAEAQKLARFGIYDVAGTPLQLKGTDDNGIPLFRKPGEGGKVSEESMKIDGHIGGLGYAASALRSLGNNVSLPERSSLAMRKGQALKDWMLGPEATKLTKEQQQLANAIQQGMGEYAALRNSGVINEGERPDIERALRGGPEEIAYAFEEMARVAQAKRKARGD